MAPTFCTMVVGSGGREHALAWKLSQSPTVKRVYVVPGNGGTETMGDKVINVDDHRVRDFESIASLAEYLKIGLAVVGPDSAIVGGIREHFDRANIPCFAPSRAAAQIEGSKIYAKKFMRKNSIPTPSYAAFSDFRKAANFVESTRSRVVIKIDGLANGKGVIVPTTKDEALSALQEIFLRNKFGSSGSSVIVEEYIEGQEISVSTLSDGKNTFTLSVGQDHKRIMDDDQGPNTGGMGVYAPVPCATPEVMEIVERTIIQPTIKAMRNQGTPFVGLLFTGIMLTATGPQVLEYNARFGDPEAQSILPLISPEVDFAKVLLACTEKRLDEVRITLSKKYTCNVVIAAEGYPGRFGGGAVIRFDSLPSGCILFHSGTKRIHGYTTTWGGRVFTVVGIGRSLEEAVDRAYEGVGSIDFKGMFFRKDIAHKSLIPMPSQNKIGG